MLNKLFLISALLAGTCLTPDFAEAAPVRGIKKICPDGSTVPYKKACPSTDPTPTPDPDPVKANVTITDVTVNEDAGEAVITVTKSGTVTDNWGFHYATSNGSATAGSDYTASSGDESELSSSTTSTFSVPITDDATDEGNENFTITLSAPTSNIELIDATGIVTIVDNDDAIPEPEPEPTKVCPDGSVVLASATCSVPMFSVQDVTVNEGAGTVTINIVKTGTNLDSSRINYATSSGSATSGSDFTATSGVLHIPRLSMQGTFTIPITNDNTVESTETFTVTITPNDNAGITDGTGIVSIIDNDTAPPPEPPPPNEPPPSDTQIQNKVVAEGDSITASGVGGYVGLYATANPTITVSNLAVGGSDIGMVIARTPGVLSANGEVVTLLIGANDLVHWNPAITTNDWLNKVWSYTDNLRARGYKVALGTILPLYQPSHPDPNYTATFNYRRRVEANPAIRNAVGTHIDAVIDFAANSTIGDDADATNTTYYPDGLHPSGAAHTIMKSIYEPVVNTLLAAGQTPNPNPPTSGGVDEPAESLEGYTFRTVTDFTYTDALDNLGASHSIGEGAPDVVGAFRMTCGANNVGYRDHILYYGEEGKSHLHDFNGHKGVTASSTFSSLLASGGSTCNWQTGANAGKAVQRSSYWVPALLDGVGNVLRADYITVYYKRRPKTDPECGMPTGVGSGPGGICIEIPNGLKSVTGNKMVYNSWGPTNIRTDLGGRPVSFKCHANGTGKYGDFVALQAGAPSCTFMTIEVHFPECWDGKYLWKNDRDHLRYAKDYGTDGKLRCEPSHPYKITTVSILYNFNITGIDKSKMKLASDYMDPTRPRGWSLHADMHIVWDARVKKILHDNCIEKLYNCSGGDLGNGQRLRGAAQPEYGFTNPNRLISEPAMPPNMVMP